MPKLKTKSCAKKRFRVTKNGKVMKKKAFLRHLLENKSHGRKLGLRKMGQLNKTDGKTIRRLMPYA